MARPYDQDAAQTLCDRLANGEPLGAICDDPAMPGLEDLADWRRQADFRARLARARQTWCHVSFDPRLRGQTLSISHGRGAEPGLVAI